MASLQELLVQEGFESGKSPKTRKPVKLRDRIAPDDRKRFGFLKQKAEKTVTGNGSSSFSSKSVGSSSERTSSKRDEPAIDEVAIRGMISILSGYIGRYLKDENFRENIRKKCNSCLVIRKGKDSDNGIFANMELVIESIDKVVENQGTRKELRMKTLRNSIRVLRIVSSQNSKNSTNGSTGGTPNSHLSACAQLYLSIVYKLEKNDRISAWHLFQVFCDSPFLARTHLLPDLWNHFFLPHLLHLKVWYSKELEILSNSDYGEKEKRLKALSKVYNDQMDLGTTQFALYYKEWLKVGIEAPPVPEVPLPPRPNNRLSRRRSSDSYASHSSINNLYRTVFGPTLERQSVDLHDRNGALINTWGLEEEEQECTSEDNYNHCYYVHNKVETHRRSSGQNNRNPNAELWLETQKLDYFQLFTCRNISTGCLVNGNQVASTKSTKKQDNTNLLSNGLSRAIATICSPDSLSKCEIAVRAISKAWLDSRGDPVTENALSKAPIIEGMLEVLYASNDDEILELAISILADLAARNEVIRQIILNSDPQLEIFMRLLRSSSLFLKAAVLLYLVKPKAKQMISTEWVPLVLRVLECGDQLQTLFTVQCSPHIAVFYFLDQLLTGFDEDRNLENARNVSVGGLSLLVRRIGIGDTHEWSSAASIISCCIRANGSCRNYLAENLNKASILELIVLENQQNSKRCAIALLTEVLCLKRESYRRTQITKFLDGLKNEWNGLNTMHILLVYLQRAPPQERPLVAAILLQLDLLVISFLVTVHSVAKKSKEMVVGDPLKCSVYREEAVEAIIEALDCQICNEKIQEQSARALVMLGGHFSDTGEAMIEKWLLHQAGFQESPGDLFQGQEPVVADRVQLNEEEEATENWQREVAIVLLNRGNKRFLAALLGAIANAIPSLAQVSLITIAWMSSFLHSVGDENLQSMACSLLVPQLLESLNYDKDVVERVLASYSLLCLTKSSECVSMLSCLDKELVDHLQNLSLFTWTANELISIIKSDSKHQ